MAVANLIPKSEPHLTDEVLQARCDALARALANVLRFCVDRGGFMKPKAQSALCEAEALLVEGEG